MKRDNIKPILIVMGINLLLSIIIIIFLTRYQYQQYVSNVNNILLQIIGKDEHKSVQILNEEKPNYDKVDLSKYGINESIAVINSMHTTYEHQIIINIIIVIIINIIFTALICLIILKYNKKILEMTNYVHKLNNRDYQLLIAENNEGELSKLQNELYKVTITLKEENVKVNDQKLYLKKTISDISHQIKTPLTSINVLVDSLNDPDMDLQIRNEFLSSISKESYKIEFLVVTLLKLARFDSNVITLKKEEINVKDLFKEVKDNLAILIELKNININFKGNRDITFIGDYKWEVEALTNILKNCLEHTPNNKNIYLSCFDNALYTKIIIKDEGEGIDKEDLKHIFERFYKTKNSSNDSIGIGLSLAYTIIKQDNGYIKVKSVLNKGTTFEIKYMK